MMDVGLVDVVVDFLGYVVRLYLQVHSTDCHCVLDVK